MKSPAQACRLHSQLFKSIPYMSLAATYLVVQRPAIGNTCPEVNSAVAVLNSSPEANQVGGISDQIAVWH